MYRLVIHASCLALVFWLSNCTLAFAQLRAGAATSNITPELGSEVVGGFLPFPATHIHDELYARCIVLDDGKTKIALVVCDSVGNSIAVSVSKRDASSSNPPEYQPVTCSSAQLTPTRCNRAGPNRYSSDEPLSDYQSFVAKRIADGVGVQRICCVRPSWLSDKSTFLNTCSIVDGS